MSIDLNQFDSSDAPSSPQSRGPLYFFIASLVVLFVVGIIIFFVFFINQGRNIVEAPSSQTNQEELANPQQSTQPEQNTQPSADPQRQQLLDGTLLRQAASTSSCADPMTDAVAFFDFVLAADSQGQWNADSQKIVTDALALLDKRCDSKKSHLLSVQHALVDPQAPPQINALVTDAAWITRVRPAPDNAEIPTGRFTTGLENIHCSIESDGASCTINNYTWSAPDTCTGKPVTFRIDPSMDQPKRGCLSAIVGETQYPYGTTLASNGYACTVASSGITCWSEFTGHGFELSRQNANQF
ncbi:hypothetical protein [Arcanobacterium pinnipediorum]|uniref:Ig-like domain-containing protein n=1 Tax=Arcanobacterium pinnipediorum TaxID=1503041 RepID=A0ABY5AI46_9ACTO|nr:hypothetical protein [Arcanobacterium pinnipediorum]USR79527.1 hypothetical protein NG665_00570 [Arcanobacterium pinnipediorum]